MAQEIKRVVTNWTVGGLIPGKGCISRYSWKDTEPQIPKWPLAWQPLLSVKWLRICILCFKWNSLLERSTQTLFSWIWTSFKVQSNDLASCQRWPVSVLYWRKLWQADSVAVSPFLNPGVISVHHVMRNDGDCRQTAQLHYRPLGNQGNLFGTFLPSFFSSLVLIITINQPSYAVLSFFVVLNLCLMN